MKGVTVMVAVMEHDGNVPVWLAVVLLSSRASSRRLKAQKKLLKKKRKQRRRQLRRQAALTSVVRLCAAWGPDRSDYVADVA